MASEIWLTADSHFFHANMYTFLNPDGTRVRGQFADAAEGDAYMIAAWNQVVKPEDHVWHLGDVTLDRSSGDIWKLEKVMKSLHGHKRLILGNHDHYDVRVIGMSGLRRSRGVIALGDLCIVIFHCIQKVSRTTESWPMSTDTFMHDMPFQGSISMCVSSARAMHLSM